MKKYILLKSSALITLVLFLIAIFVQSMVLSYVTVILLGITCLFYIYDIVIETGYTGIGDLISRFPVMVSRQKNPFGFWTLVILETIGVLIVIGAGIYGLIK